jgi:hypothetical protein
METKDLTENKNIYVVFIQEGSLDETQFGKKKLEWGVSSAVFAMTLRR